MKPIRISGVGCCLLDRIYGHIDFRAPSFQKYLSRRPGDGGLEPGKLQFEEEVERFAGRKFAEFLPDLTQGFQPDKENIGGPCIVALINAAQLAGDESHVSFYGCRGEDAVGDSLVQALAKTPVDLSHYRLEPGGETAATTVLSDPTYDNGHSERTFVNTIGASWRYLPEEVDESFYGADICVFGGTAIVPMIHRGLRTMLAKAKDKGCLTVVNTVYDSLSEKQNPGQRWLLGDSDATYALIDLLLVDCEEALRLSGTDTITESIAFFREKGTKSVLVTNGARDVYLWADSDRFGQVPEYALPVSAAVGERLKQGVKGDSTGCGDNFAGGVIASLARQMYASQTRLDLREACCWGVVSGGFACFYYGGTYFEDVPGEKRQHLLPYYEKYLRQIGGE
jgi:sugar/nucleoside kinase (ribokinase family)